MTESTAAWAEAHAVGRFFRAVDTREWPVVEALLASTVTTDYTSLFGGEVETLRRADLVGRWRGLLPGFDATQHLLGPLLPTGAGVWECNVRAHHYLDGEEWMVAGWYVLGLHAVGPDGSPLVAAITLQATQETGSRGLVERAVARAAG